MPAPSDDFVSRVLEVVESIPPGHVMTYGEVAATIGSRAARAVGTVMARYGSDVAWWRVIRSGGHPPLAHEDRALVHYEAESTPLKWMPDGSYRVDLRSARHRP
ncbi:MGMT family protein [Salinibacterium sp. NSLL150]|uniref:MGMT family protein n=1 Tax=unclassified Salinibacterium TaxID=2632331 RepID=UPI0018CDCC50|nr:MULTISPECIES: MGMT family protein [unclassified Salinibacterium]MBH0098324.1 MGMT family protein [Salinibacterium sp. NSLL35]MBH0101079.1 MGMT family protein [Salinibacterium sp. NSLL150]MBH0103838.1 MGMT family protein [Salinibacterium sp. NSLL16]MBH0106599.1 MGMT family protein [Salinibacterium sp. NSLL17]MBH0109636.1 MGMT family protein [Salinibacterium sp. NG22]